MSPFFSFVEMSPPFFVFFILERPASALSFATSKAGKRVNLPLFALDFFLSYPIYEHGGSPLLDAV